MQKPPVLWRDAHHGNYSQGRAGITPDRIVIHVADGGFEGTLSWFRMAACDVSAHFTVASDGRVGQSVSEYNTAWHSGNLAMNRRSFGIEHEGKQPGWCPTPAQLSASARLVAYLCQRWGIPADREHIISHWDVNRARTDRRNCPGDGWPWDKYLGMVQALIAADGEEAAHKPTPADKEVVRLFNPATDKQIGTATLIPGTDKVYIPESVLAELKR